MIVNRVIQRFRSQRHFHTLTCLFVFSRVPDDTDVRSTLLRLRLPSNSPWRQHMFSPRTCPILRPLWHWSRLMLMLYNSSSFYTISKPILKTDRSFHLYLGYAGRSWWSLETVGTWKNKDIYTEESYSALLRKCFKNIINKIKKSYLKDYFKKHVDEGSQG